MFREMWLWTERDLTLHAVVSLFLVEVYVAWTDQAYYLWCHWNVRGCHSFHYDLDDNDKDDGDVGGQCASVEDNTMIAMTFTDVDEDKMEFSPQHHHSSIISRGSLFVSQVGTQYFAWSPVCLLYPILSSSSGGPAVIFVHLSYPAVCRQKVSESYVLWSFTARQDESEGIKMEAYNRWPKSPKQTSKRVTLPIGKIYVTRPWNRTEKCRTLLALRTPMCTEMGFTGPMEHKHWLPEEGTLAESAGLH